MKNIGILFLSVVLLASWTMSAQVEQGTLKFEITEASSDDPQAAQVSEMMIGSKTVIFFQKDKSLARIDMMGGMIKIDMITKPNSELDMLLDIMGQKMWVNVPETEAAKLRSESPEMEITYDKNDKKTIAGYECYRMDVQVDGSTEMMITAYITEELQLEAPVIQGVDMTQFAGFPLEYVISGGPITLTMTAQSFSNEVDTSVFDYDTSQYKKMTMDELKSLGGGSFGF